MPNGLQQARRRAHRFLRPQVSSREHKSSNSTETPPPLLHSLLGLPAEIKQIILSSLSDVASLEALIFTCSSLYHSFLDSESSILAKILVNQITPGLMRNAFAVYESSKKVPGGIHTADYLSLLFNGDEMPSSALPKWGLRDALVLSKTHGNVQFWANEFASSALFHHPVTGKPEMNLTPISAGELSRIERSLYRFQFYCNLYALRNRGCSNYLDVIFISFAGFAPWENEQLICIREFLREAVSDCMRSSICTERLRTADFS